MIVLVCASFFMISLVFGIRRGVLLRTVRRWMVNHHVDRQHLLRAVYEMIEKKGAGHGDEKDWPALLEPWTETTWWVDRLPSVNY